MPAVRTSPKSPKSPAKTPKKASPKEPLTVEIKPSVLYQSRITNGLYHQIVVKTLEFALDKHMDWHKLSQAILADEEAAGIIRVASPKKGKGKGKAKGKGKEKEEDEEQGKEAKVDESKNCPKGLTGIELHDHFHNIILPAIKAGIPIWLGAIEPVTPTASEQVVAEGSQSPGMTE